MEPTFVVHHLLLVMLFNHSVHVSAGLKLECLILEDVLAFLDLVFQVHDLGVLLIYDLLQNTTFFFKMLLHTVELFFQSIHLV